MVVTKQELEEIVAGCDPGVRRLVRLLNERHFDTTDSGDGVTKYEANAQYRKSFKRCASCESPGPDAPCTCPEFSLPYDEGCMIPAPHVIIQVDDEVESVEGAADRLLTLMRTMGIEVKALTPDDECEPNIQASYCPVTQIGIIELMYVTDDDLPDGVGMP
jgi:hypothetical protein